MTSEIITVIADLALTLSFITAIIFGIAQVKAAARDRRERLTLETLHNFQTREFAEHIHYIVNNEMPANREEFQAPCKRAGPFYPVRQEMESLGIMVAERFIDIDLVDKTLCSFVTTSWEKYKPMYLDIREQQPDPFLENISNGLLTVSMNACSRTPENLSISKDHLLPGGINQPE